ncbi:MAG: hypothetical protein IKY69_02890 [Bacteroidaceae bacterium]|nr:hypothetical protein [Bacteroidaceae bacterium]
MNRLLKKIIKRVLIAFATLFLTVVIFIVIMFLELVGIVEFNIKNKTDYLILWEWWWNKDSNGESIIDVAEVMPFDWDYFVKYSQPDNLENIKKEFNIETDIYDITCHELRVMFIKDNRVVFYEDWDWEGHPYVYPKGAALFANKYLVVKKEDAKFKASKDKDGDLWLEKIE